MTKTTRFGTRLSQRECTLLKKGTHLGIYLPEYEQNSQDLYQMAPEYVLRAWRAMITCVVLVSLTTADALVYCVVRVSPTTAGVS